jgi:hypothetical protein
VTCTDQPADQVVGARSAGPDGVLETDDDIVSWTLDDAMRLARGARWKPAIAPALPVTDRAPPAPASPAPRRRPKGPIAPPAARDDSTLDLDGDGIPDRRK